MISPKVLAKGPFSPEDITINLVEKSNRKIDPFLENQIPQIWDETKKMAAKRKQQLYNGQSYRLEDLAIHDKKLHFTASLISYDIRSSLSKYADKLSQLGQNYYVNGLTVGGLIKTTDQKYVFGQRGPSSPTRERVDIIGGILEEVNLKTGWDILAKNYSEVQEETGVTKDYITRAKIVAMLLSKTTNIIIFTSLYLTLSSQEVTTVFQTQPHEDEMSDLIFVSEEQLKPFLLELGGYKTAMAQLLDVI